MSRNIAKTKSGKVDISKYVATVFPVLVSPEKLIKLLRGGSLKPGSGSTKAVAKADNSSAKTIPGFDKPATATPKQASATPNSKIYTFAEILRMALGNSAKPVKELNPDEIRALIQFVGSAVLTDYEKIFMYKEILRDLDANDPIAQDLRNKIALSEIKSIRNAS